MEVVKLLTSDLYHTSPPTEGSKFYEEMFQSIKEHGMVHPIVVYKCTVKEWRDPRFPTSELAVKPVPFLKDDQVVYLVMCGNNRLSVLRKLNMMHAKCVVCTDFQEVNKLCKKQRTDWNSRLRELSKPRQET